MATSAHIARLPPNRNAPGAPDSGSILPHIAESDGRNEPGRRRRTLATTCDSKTVRINLGIAIYGSCKWLFPIPSKPLHPIRWVSRVAPNYCCRWIPSIDRRLGFCSGTHPNPLPEKELHGAILSRLRAGLSPGHGRFVRRVQPGGKSGQLYRGRSARTATPAGTQAQYSRRLSRHPASGVACTRCVNACSRAVSVAARIAIL